MVRGRIGDREPKLFGTVFLGASILLAALLFLGAALLAAPAIQVAVADKAPDPGAASLLRSAAAGVLTVVLPRVATLVMFSTASLARATRALPRWLVLLTYAVGVYELVNVTVDAPSIFLVPAWIALVSVVLLVRRPAHPFELDAATPQSARPTDSDPPHGGKAPRRPPDQCTGGGSSQVGSAENSTVSQASRSSSSSARARARRTSSVSPIARSGSVRYSAST